jgi:CDP-2,3-bis-(O-geranylgeranyl)-sn-glycerol synthase
LLWELAYALWFVFPAYAANGAPVVLSHFYRGVLHPIDGGRAWRDGRRLLGNSKSVEGFLAGVVAGSAAGFLEAIFAADPALTIARGFVLSVGAMLGDLAGSFAKRRLGLEPGAPAPLLDQLDFLLVAVGLAYALGMADISLTGFTLLIALTLLLHYSTNYVAYKLGWKKVPW